ncbi:MAG: L,D-transpeptidase family protein [Chitinophagaceae bacterium]
MKRVLFSVACLLIYAFINEPKFTHFAKSNRSALFSSNKKEDKLIYPLLVDTFYLMNEGKLFWYKTDTSAISLREQLVAIIDTTGYYGLISKAYHVAELKSILQENFSDSLLLYEADRIYTDAAIAVFKDIYQGYNMKPWVGFDQVSAKYAMADDEFLLQLLLNATSSVKLKNAVAMLEPADAAYASLKKELYRQKERNKKDSVASLLLSMNYYRWIHHFKFDRFIVVNLAAARLQYYEDDSLLLQMKTVLGKSSTPTPRFAAWCDQVILYPYWYVPKSIIFNEYMPILKKNPSWLDAHNMQVVDASGKVLDHHGLDWSSFHSGYFPYSIRQSTGCDNALGVIKFNINTPYGVYLHDTNNKTAFFSASRYYSHGCIRLEDPIGLGSRLLGNKLDTTYLQSCFKKQKPVYRQLDKPVPVFVVYMRAQTDTKGKVVYFRDVYRLMK